MDDCIVKNATIKFGKDDLWLNEETSYGLAEVEEQDDLVGINCGGGGMKAYKIYLVARRTVHHGQVTARPGELIGEFFGVGEDKQEALWNSEAASYMVNNKINRSAVNILYHCLGSVDLE